MSQTREIVITGLGVVSPIGIGGEAFWNSLCEGRSGVRRLEVFNGSDLPPAIGADVSDFDPKQYVRPRKSLKVMSRDIQLAFAAADLACAQASLESHPIDPERLGIVFGADMIACDLSEMIDAFRGCIVEGRFDFDRWGEQSMAQMFPLWMLKYLPNMPACHVGIALDARGPNNSLTLGEVSSLAAIAEAVRVIERGQADAMVAGGASSRVHPTIWAYRSAFHLSKRTDDPAAACRPFDLARDGMIHGEGAGTFVLEERRSAEARGATILARVLGFATTFEPRAAGKELRGKAIRASITQALRSAGLQPDQVGHVNANGLSTALDDRLEAQAIRDTLGDVPVTAPKSFFGNLGAGTGAVEMVASVLAFQHGLVPFTLNYEQADPDCPVNVIRQTPMKLSTPVALILNQARIGQSVAVVLAAP
jgi:3-oxoacyl-[acyl-carrier-protein] synthase II